MKKIFVTGLAFVLAIVASITGTLAWLTAKTEAVTNTFTVGDVAIKLVEHEYSTTNTATITETENGTQNYPLIPGTTYAKDPTVSVEGSTTVDCWLFVKFEEINNPSTYLTYTSSLNVSDEGWTKLEGEEDVWYREVKTTDTTKSWKLLKDDKVEVKDNIVKAGVTAGTGEVNMPASTAQPQLKYTAYAAQKDNLTVTEAWNQVKGLAD